MLRPVKPVGFGWTGTASNGLPRRPRPLASARADLHHGAAAARETSRWLDDARQATATVGLVFDQVDGGIEEAVLTMAGLLELFTRYVDEFGSDPFTDAADRARAEAPNTAQGPVGLAEHRAAEDRAHARRTRPREREGCER